jgi:azurin
MKKLLILSAFVVPVFLASCGGGQPKTESESASSEVVSGTDEHANHADAAEVAVQVVSNDQMKFDLSEIKVKAGEKVVLTLKNEGTLPKESMGHNLVILKPGTDMADYAMKAINSKDTEYIPSSEEGSVVAHTKLLGPGESDTITFTLEKGEYEFLCSFPGHYSLMRGKIIVE